MNSTDNKLFNALALVDKLAGVKSASFMPIQGPAAPAPPPADPAQQAAMQQQAAQQAAPPPTPPAQQGPDVMAELQGVLGNIAQTIQQMGSAMETLKAEIDGQNKDLDGLRREMVVMGAKLGVMEKALQQSSMEPPMMMDPRMMGGQFGV